MRSNWSQTSVLLCSEDHTLTAFAIACLMICANTKKKTLFTALKPNFRVELLALLAIVL